MKNLAEEQKLICKKYGADYLEAPENSIIGISRNVKNGGEIPINGLRHQSENDTSGWYIWAGDYSEEDDFFQPMHLEHLNEVCPWLKKYLGLAPGWRFLVTSDYEDVWEDRSLLHFDSKNQ